MSFILKTQVSTGDTAGQAELVCCPGQGGEVPAPGEPVPWEAGRRWDIVRTPRPHHSRFKPRRRGRGVCPVRCPQHVPCVLAGGPLVLVAVGLVLSTLWASSQDALVCVDTLRGVL